MKKFMVSLFIVALVLLIAGFVWNTFIFILNLIQTAE